MTDLQAVADRVEIEALRAEFSDASLQHDWDRFASLFTSDGTWAMPHIDVELVGRDTIRTEVERLRGTWAFFVQNTHPGVIELDGDTATGRAYIEEFGRFRDGSSNLNSSLYHDRYERTPEGWRFAERCYEVRYVDPSPLPGSSPEEGGSRGPHS